ncbi:uncharacterized protein [Panulirus ornatus]|uniref:uncharacterized protein isoform X2 n=1 Tax=Panulirus ornatus TaxID=150431 RepID=UPI003A878070
MAKMIAVALLLCLGLILKDPMAPRTKRQVPLPPSPGSPVAPAPQTIPDPPSPGSPVAPAPQTIPDPPSPGSPVAPAPQTIPDPPSPGSPVAPAPQTIPDPPSPGSPVAPATQTVPVGGEQVTLIEKQLQRDPPRGTQRDHVLPGGPPRGTQRDHVLPGGPPRGTQRDHVLPGGPPRGTQRDHVLPGGPPRGTQRDHVLPGGPPRGTQRDHVLPGGPPRGTQRDHVLPGGPPRGTQRDHVLPGGPPRGTQRDHVLPGGPPRGTQRDHVLPGGPPRGTQRDHVLPGGPPRGTQRDHVLPGGPPRGTQRDHVLPGGPPRGTLRGDRVLGEPSAPVAGSAPLATEDQQGASGPPHLGPWPPTLPSSVRYYNGRDVRIDSCPRDQVRLPDGGCHQLLTQGPCNVTEYVLLDADTRQGYCAPRLCAPDRIFVFSDQLCHDPREAHLCTAGRDLYQTAFGTPVCQCPGGTYEGDLDLGDDLCLPILAPTPACPPGQVLWFRDFTLRQECLPDPCGGQNLRRRPAELPFVPSHLEGRCYQLGQEGGGICGPGTLYGLGLGSLRGACITLEDAGYIVLDNETLAFFQEFYGPFIPNISPEASRENSQLGLLEEQLTGGELDPPAVETEPDQEARIRGQDPTRRTTCHTGVRGPLVQHDTVLGEVRHGVGVPVSGLRTKGPVPVGPVARGPLVKDSLQQHFRDKVPLPRRPLTMRPLTMARALYRPPTAGGTREKPLGTGLPHRGSHSGHGARKTVIERVVSGELVAMVTLRGNTPYDLSPDSARDLDAAISLALTAHDGEKFSGFRWRHLGVQSRVLLPVMVVGVRCVPAQCGTRCAGKLGEVSESGQVGRSDAGGSGEVGESGEVDESGEVGGAREVCGSQS